MNIGSKSAGSTSEFWAHAYWIQKYGMYIQILHDDMMIYAAQLFSYVLFQISDRIRSILKRKNVARIVYHTF